MKILSTSLSLLFLAALALPTSVFAASQQVTVTFTGTTNFSSLAQQEAAEFGSGVFSSSTALPSETKPMPLLRPPVKGAGSKVVQHHAATPMANDAQNNASQNATVTPLLRGFTGLRHLDSRLARGGNQFSIEPPDQALAVGNGFVLEAVNCAIAVYDTNGIIALNANGTTAYPVALTTFFGIGPAFNRSTGNINANPGDVVALYDPVSNRWFVEAWAQDVFPSGNGKNTTKIYLAVSQTGDPRGAYNQFTITVTGFITDYAKIGVDNNGLYISENDFQLVNIGPPTNFVPVNFLGARIFAARKSDLEAGISTPAFTFFLPFNTGFEFTIMPQIAPPGTAYLNSNNGTTYFVSSHFVNNTEASLGVWALTNTNNLNGGTSPTLKGPAAVNTESFNFPSQAVLQQAGFTPLGTSVGASLEQLDPGDFRIGGQNIIFTNSQLFATLATEVTDSFGNQVMGADWFVLHPTITGGTLAATVTAQGVISLNGASFLRPAIAMNTQLFGALVGTQVGTSDFPSAAVVGFNGFTPGAVTVNRAGNEPEDGFSGYAAFGGGGVARWGDYEAVGISNVDNSLWTATMYTPDMNRTSLANWATYVTRVQLNH